MTILIMAENAPEEIQLCMTSLRRTADYGENRIILADLSGESQVQEWCAAQTDMEYVRITEGGPEKSYGIILNRVMEQCSVEDDLLVATGHFMFAPQSIVRLQQALSAPKWEKAGAVGPASNGFWIEQHPETPLNTYVQMERYEAQSAGEKNEKALSLWPEAILFGKKAMEEAGAFDEKLTTLRSVMKDYLLRIICLDYAVVRCRNAFLYDVRQGAAIQEIVMGDAKAESAYLEQKWGMHYFNENANAQLIDLITREPQETFSVLEIGCDCGANLLGIQNRYPNAKVYGVEICQGSAAIAGHLTASDIRVTDIEQEQIDFGVLFDYIIFGDVLEHLHEPAGVLLHCRQMLAEKGCVITSIPNLMHISVMGDLLNGYFTYTEAGLLDKTHVHLFTYYEIVEMFTKCGYSVKGVDGIVSELNEQEEQLVTALLQHSQSAEKFMYQTYQYLVTAEKA